jgi:hypothetical protein
MTIEQNLRTVEVLEALQLIETSEELNIAVSPTSKLKLRTFIKGGGNYLKWSANENDELGLFDEEK